MLGAARQSGSQIGRHTEDLSLAVLACDQQAKPCQLLQIAAGCLVADAMAALVGDHRVGEAVIPQSMAKQGQLAMVQAIHAVQWSLQYGRLIGLALQVGMQIADGLLDHLGLSQQEIG